MPAPAVKSAALEMTSQQRKEIFLAAMIGNVTVTELAQSNSVSRKFVYQQKSKADQALTEAFINAALDEQVIFTVPVTKAWIRQLVLSLTLTCHCSFRGVQELFSDLFDYDHLSLGTVHNIIAEAVERARKINAAAELTGIRVGAHDEIYQAGKPVLVGADADSTFCYLLSAEQSCDETTWGVRLLELAERGLKLDYSVADGGKALRAGQKAAWETVPCHGDVFHAERDFSKLVFYLERRSAGCTTARKKLENKMERAKKRAKGHTISVKLAVARKAETQAVSLATDIRILAEWINDDVLSLAGPESDTRRELFDFITAELKAREHLCPHRIAPLRKMLENQRDNLLAFVDVLKTEFEQISEKLNVPMYLTWRICELQGISEEREAYWQKKALLQKRLGNRYYDTEKAVTEAMKKIHRASSIVENINSRLRNYFFLRKQIGNDYLELLRFFLNHRKFIRSERQERVDKSPAELLYGRPHPHWLELLGFERFKQN
jgi:hypothetical protein